MHVYSIVTDGKEISRGKLSEDIILNTMLSSPPVELDCKNKTVSAEPEIYGFTCTWKKPNKPSWIHNQTEATRLGHGDIRYRLTLQEVEENGTRSKYVQLM